MDDVNTTPNIRDASLPRIEEEVSQLIATTLGIAFQEDQAGSSLHYIPSQLDLIGLYEQTGHFQHGAYCADLVLPLQVSLEENPLSYLFSCYSRCTDQESDIQRRFSGSLQEDEDCLNRLLSELDGVRDRVIATSGEFLTQYSQIDGETAADIFADILFLEGVPENFLRHLILFYEAEGLGFKLLQPIFEAVLDIIRERMIDLVQYSPKHVLQPLRALQCLLHEKELCFLLVSRHCFFPDLSEYNLNNRKKFMQDSFMAPFFSFSLLPPMEDTVYLRKFIELSTGSVDILQISPMLTETVDRNVYEAFPFLQDIKETLFQICFQLCTACYDSQSAFLSWFRAVLNLNKKRTAMQANCNAISEDGFMFNVMYVLVRLSTCLSRNTSLVELDSIDPRFPQAEGHIDFSNETRLAADSDMLKQWRENDENPITREHLNLKTKCFSLAIRSVHLSYIPLLSMFEKMKEALDRLFTIIEQLEKEKNGGILSTTGEIELRALTEKVIEIRALKQCYDQYFLRDGDTTLVLLRFAIYTANWLVRVLAFPCRESFLPLPLPVESRFASLPEAVIDVILKILNCTMKHWQSMVKVHLPQMGGIVTMILAALSSPSLFKNPHMRIRFLELLYCLMSNPEFTTISKVLMSTHEVSQQFLARSLLQMHVEIEKDRFGMSALWQYQYRCFIRDIFTILWDVGKYRISVQNTSRNGFLFLQVSNVMLTDMSESFDQQLRDLRDIKYFEDTFRNRSDLTFSDREKDNMMRNVRASFMEDNRLINSSLDMLSLLTKDDVLKRSFLRPEVLDQLAEFLNYSVERLLTVRGCRSEISEPEEVGWNPDHFFGRLFEIYTNFQGKESFAKAVGLDPRSYSKELFSNSIMIAKTVNSNCITDAVIGGLEELAFMAEELMQEEKAAEKSLGDIPDDFLDPVMGTLMTDPVRLPTSRKVMDRVVIHKILLNQKRDPFNRMFLSPEMLEPETDLKQRLNQFLSDHRRLK